MFGNAAVMLQGKYQIVLDNSSTQTKIHEETLIYSVFEEPLGEIIYSEIHVAPENQIVYGEMTNAGSQYFRVDSAQF